eukprot:8649473-Lingulodinium_polyedra.AAC.1
MGRGGRPGPPPLRPFRPRGGSQRPRPWGRVAAAPPAACSCPSRPRRARPSRAPARAPTCPA